MPNNVIDHFGAAALYFVGETEQLDGASVAAAVVLVLVIAGVCEQLVLGMPGNTECRGITGDL